MRTTIASVKNGAPQWFDRSTRKVIPVEQWGRSHWDLLIHVEGRAVDHHGGINWDLLTLSQRNWPMLYAARTPWESAPVRDAADQYGLVLRGPDGEEVSALGYCDGDALMDLVDAGLVTVAMPPVSPTGNSYLRPDDLPLSSPSPLEPVTGHVLWLLMPWARFGITSKGWELVGAVRRHKADGGSLGTFVPDVEGS